MPEISDLTVARKLIQIKKSADDRKFPFDMPFSEVKKLLTTKRCFFTKVELTNEHKQPNTRSFDRVDNSVGYIKGNVVACAEGFNQRKGNITVEDVEILYKMFKKKKLVK